jgi:hypothetical protein
MNILETPHWRTYQDALIRAEKAEAALTQLQAERDALQQERDEAMRVLSPNMPESGLVDACKQVKQAQITAASNFSDLEAVSGFCEAHTPTIPMPHEECPCCRAVALADKLAQLQGTITALSELVELWKEYAQSHEIAARNHEAIKSVERWPQEHRRIARAYTECADELEARLSAPKEENT